MSSYNNFMLNKIIQNLILYKNVEHQFNVYYLVFNIFNKNYSNSLKKKNYYVTKQPFHYTIDINYYGVTVQ